MWYEAKVQWLSPKKVHWNKYLEPCKCMACLWPCLYCISIFILAWHHSHRAYCATAFEFILTTFPEPAAWGIFVVWATYTTFDDCFDPTNSFPLTPQWSHTVCFSCSMYSPLWSCEKSTLVILYSYWWCLRLSPSVFFSSTSHSLIIHWGMISPSIAFSFC